MNAPMNVLNLQPASLVKLVRARPLLGTLVEIAATGADAQQVQLALASAYRAVEQIHVLMSYQDADSDVSRINRDAYNSPIEIDPHTYRVLRAAQLMAQASNGVFDITVAPTLNWLGYLPRHANSPRASAGANWKDIRLLPDNRVRLDNSLRIDLSGIAKGYAVDVAIKALREAGMFAGRVNAGGDLRVFGEGEQSIMVRNPAAHTQTIPLLALTEGAAATSAGYYSSRRHQVRVITPIINPLTRTACDSGRSVTVLARDCMTADALTKVVYANPGAALPVLKYYNARALIVENNPLTHALHIFDSSQN